LNQKIVDGVLEQDDISYHAIESMRAELSKVHRCHRNVMETERLFIITEEERNRELLGLPVAAVTVWPALPAFPVVINIEGLLVTHSNFHVI